MAPAQAKAGPGLPCPGLVKSPALPPLLWLIAAVLVAFALVPTRRPAVQSAGMATVTKSKKPVRKPAARRTGIRRPAPVADWGIPAPIAPPAGKGTAAELLADVRAGEFMKGVDLAKVDRARKSRSTRR